jgi:PEP-CTERM motif
MKRILQCAIPLGMLFGAVAPTQADVIVYAGYLNTIPPVNPADIPTPFDPSATTTLISTGGSTTPHDTGIIRFLNTGGAAVTIDSGVKVTVQNGSFQLWDGSLPFVLNPGNNLVLAETDHATVNFDSSDFGLGSNPLVAGSVNGQAFAFTDTARILLGHEDALNGPETTEYGILGRISIGGTSVPEPSTLALLLGAVLGLPYFAKRRRAT